MRRWLALLPLTACTGGPVDACAQTLFDAAMHIQDRWPSAAAALDTAYDDGTVWYWSHQRRSVDGYGVTMAHLSEPPGLDDVFDLELDVHADGDLHHPSLLFFDQRGADPADWPVIGAGYHFDYTPCARPDLPCVASGDYFVHEAGYHTVLIGDGGMLLATDADLKRGARADTVDPEGCEDIDSDELLNKVNTVKHGRAWDVHLWFDPSCAAPTLAVEDPERRWTNADNRVTITDGAFYFPDDAACGCD